MGQHSTHTVHVGASCWDICAAAATGRPLVCFGRHLSPAEATCSPLPAFHVHFLRSCVPVVSWHWQASESHCSGCSQSLSEGWLKHLLVLLWLTLVDVDVDGLLVGHELLPAFPVTVPLRLLLLLGLTGSDSCLSSNNLCFHRHMTGSHLFGRELTLSQLPRRLWNLWWLPHL